MCFTHMLNSMFQNILVVVLYSYVAASGFMLQVISVIFDVSCVLYICCKCMFQVFHLF
jgi:hypothetical protein